MFKKLMLLAFFTLITISFAQVKIIDQKKAEKVALNWVNLVVTTNEKWNNESRPIMER